MQSRTRRALIVAPWVAIGLIFLACGGGTRPAPAPDVSTGASAASGPGSSAATPAPLGTSVEPAKGWTVAVVSASLDADKAMATVNEFQHPQAGQRYVLVQLGIRNGSDRPAAPMSNVKLSALSKGVASPVGFDLVPAPKLDLNAQLQPGTTAQGWVPFQVPATADDVVLLAEPLITLNQNEDQRFLSLH